MFNVVMVGDSSVGKTSFIRRLERGQFYPDPSATLGKFDLFLLLLFLFVHSLLCVLIGVQMCFYTS